MTDAQRITMQDVGGKAVITIYTSQTCQWWTYLGEHVEEITKFVEKYVDDDTYSEFLFGIAEFDDQVIWDALNKAFEECPDALAYDKDHPEKESLLKVYRLLENDFDSTT